MKAVGLFFVALLAGCVDDGPDRVILGLHSPDEPGWHAVDDKEWRVVWDPSNQHDEGHNLGTTIVAAQRGDAVHLLPATPELIMPHPQVVDDLPHPLLYPLRVPDLAVMDGNQSAWMFGHPDGDAWRFEWRGLSWDMSKTREGGRTTIEGVAVSGSVGRLHISYGAWPWADLEYRIHGADRQLRWTIMTEDATQDRLAVHVAHGPVVPLVSESVELPPDAASAEAMFSTQPTGAPVHASIALSCIQKPGESFLPAEDRGTVSYDLSVEGRAFLEGRMAGCQDGRSSWFSGDACLVPAGDGSLRLEGATLHLGGPTFVVDAFVGEWQAQWLRRDLAGGLVDVDAPPTRC